MNNNDRRIHNDDGDRLLPHGGGAPYQHTEPPQPEFNLLVAGCRGGKTSFLRLLLDTSVVSPRTTKEQLASVAKFVQGCSGHTAYIRSVSVDVDLALEDSGQRGVLGLTLMDTPSLDFKDDVAAERMLSETMRHIDARFAEGVDDEWKAKSGYRYVHLCIYFLDPDQIVPPAVPGPHVPLIPRGRANSFSQPDHEPVILEPPVTTNPLLARPALPQADVAAIRRLSARVNVLPVIARADILSNDRLAAVKLAIRRDLAEAGIGFGIFDTDPPLTVAQDELAAATAASRPESSNGYHGPNGASTNTTPPTSPTAPPLLRLPYALISPDMYSHSDGVSRRAPSRHELVQQYTPVGNYSRASVYPRGKFVRSYRWGNLDVLDPAHSDFVSLRNAIFHHMETLQRYTQMYLFEKFRADYLLTRLSPIHNVSHNIQHMPPMGHASRPILAIDTAPPHPPHRHTVPAQPHRDVYPGDVQQQRSAPAPTPRPMPDQTPTSTSRPTAPRVKPRTKKITVACNFCRSRKLKCDGGRPTCGQCLKRSHPCDYMPQNKRRGTQRTRKGEDSGSESGDERSPDGDEPSVSPELTSQPPSRRSSNVGRVQDGYPSSIPSMSAMSRDGASSAGSSARPKLESGMASAPPPRGYFPDNEVPPIATLPAVDAPTTPAPMSAPTLPPIRPASDLQAAQRKRAATVPGKVPRQTTSSGPKVVACNFCRTRKTKCDGAHPSCASCTRRQLDCSYVHDSNGSNGSGNRRARRPSSSKAPTVESPGSLSPPSSRMVPTPSTGDARDVEMHGADEMDLKRPMEYDDSHRSLKKMRIDNAIP